MIHNPIRRLNRITTLVNRDDYYHTFLHEELSQVIMEILDNGEWMEIDMVTEIQKLSSMSAGRRARAGTPWIDGFAFDELNKALMDIWVEQERTVPTKEFIENLKQYVL